MKKIGNLEKDEVRMLEQYRLHNRELRRRSLYVKVSDCRLNTTDPSRRAASPSGTARARPGAGNRSERRQPGNRVRKQMSVGGNSVAVNR